MSADRQYGKVVFICNGCDDSIETDERDFAAALLYLKRESWVARRHDGSSSWKHFCPSCKNDEQATGDLRW